MDAVTGVAAWSHPPHLPPVVEFPRGTRPHGSEIKLHSHKDNITSALLGGLPYTRGVETKIRKANYWRNGLFNIGNLGI